jgi:hypothetical protein
MDKYGNPLPEGTDDMESGPVGFIPRAKTGGPIATGKFKPEGALGSVYVKGVRRSARLNPALAILDTVTATVPVTKDELNTELKGISAIVSKFTGGKRRQRGGDDELVTMLAQVIQREDVQAKLAIVKSVAMMGIYNGKIALQQGYKDTEGMRMKAKEYFMANYAAPLLGVGTKLFDIGAKLADQLIVKAPVTLTMLSAAGVGYTFNVTAEIIRKFNHWGRKTTDEFLSDEKAKKAAEWAVQDAMTSGKTALVGVAVANQLGLLPASALLAAILFALQINVASPTGRGYMIASFYAWYAGQPKETQEEVKKAATEYAVSVKNAAVKGAPQVKAAAKAAGKTLGPLLVAGGKTAFAAVAEGAREAGHMIGIVPSELLVNDAAAVSALENGGVAAAIAVDRVGAGDASAAAVEVPPPEAAAPAVDEAAVGAPEAAAAASAAPSSSVTAFQAAVRARAAASKAAKEAEAAAAAPAEGVAEAPARRSSKKGGQKTKKRSAKRRSTRRRKAPKYLAAPVFAY